MNKKSTTILTALWMTLAFALVPVLRSVLRADDVPTHGGRTYAYVYDSGRPGLDDLAAAAHRLYQSANGLDPTVFPSIAQLENDVVAAVAGLLGGDGASVGTVTSGGTESCLLAVKAARDRWRAAGGNGTPTIVLPVTAANISTQTGANSWSFGIQGNAAIVQAIANMQAYVRDEFAQVAAAKRAGLAPDAALKQLNLSKHAPAYGQGVTPTLPAVQRIYDIIDGKAALN